MCPGNACHQSRHAGGRPASVKAPLARGCLRTRAAPQWLEADFAAADRCATPWLAVAMHRPMYVVFPHKSNRVVGEHLRASLERLFEDAQARPGPAACSACGGTGARAAAAACVRCCRCVRGAAGARAPRPAARGRQPLEATRSTAQRRSAVLGTRMSRRHHHRRHHHQWWSHHHW